MAGHMGRFCHVVILKTSPRFEIGPNDSKTFQGCTWRQSVFSLTPGIRSRRQKLVWPMIALLIRVHGVQLSLSPLLSLIH